MPIEFRCSTCGKLLRVGDDSAGKKSRCPECGNIQDIPGAVSSPPGQPFPAGPYPHAGTTPPGHSSPASGPASTHSPRPTPSPTSPRPGAVPMGGAPAPQPTFGSNPYAERQASGNPYATPSGYTARPGGYGPFAGSPEDYARSRLSGPAIALIVFAVLGLAFSALAILGFIVQVAENSFDDDGVPGLVWVLANLVLRLVMLAGGIQMLRVRSYGLSMAAAVTAIIPCGMCCFMDLPFGIWALVVLLDANVRNAFH